MEENKDKQDHAFAKKLIIEAGLETPKLDFTKTVMDALKTKETIPASLQYSPLISPAWWGFISALVVAIFTYVLLSESTLESSWLTLHQFHGFAEYNVFETTLKQPIAMTAVYGCVALAVLVLVQIPLLKKYFNRYYALD